MIGVESIMFGNTVDRVMCKINSLIILRLIKIASNKFTVGFVI